MTDHDVEPAGDDAGTQRSVPGFPWPPGEGESIIDAWGQTWHRSSLEPGRFFASMPREDSLGAAVLYYLSIGIPVAGAQLLWTMLRGGRGASPDSIAGAFGATGAWSPLIDFLFSPVILLLSLFLAAAMTHVLLKLFGGAAGDYGTTARVFAYSYSPQVLGVIPVLGDIAGSIWMVVIAIVGLREAHRTTTGRAAAAVLIPLIIVLGFAVLVFLLAQAGELFLMP